MRRALLLLLSLFFLYSSVLWAVENCLRSAEHIGHKDDGDAHGAGLASEVDSHLPPETRLHCLDSHDQIGPALQSSSASRLAPSIRGVALKALSSPGFIATSQARDFWLRAPFRRFSSLSFLSGLPLQVILSVFLI